MSNKTLAILVSVLVLASVVAAVFTVGGPAHQRKIKFDEQRVADLQSIQTQIINYWQKKGTLPANLSDLTDSISGYKAPVDPETQASYEYTVSSTYEFQLCANFNLPTANPSRTQPAIYPYDNWNHSGGRYCFDKNIDPQLYKLPPVPTK